MIAACFELAGLPVRLTEGDYANYKITTKEDLQKEKTMRIVTDTTFTA